MSSASDLYSNIGEIREALDVLLQRGKPVSMADLQALVATVEATSRPTVTLSAEQVAQQLVPQLLPLLPTPATLEQAGQQAARQIEAAIAAGTQASTQQITASVLESTRQLTAATEVLTAAAQQMPRSVPVDFLRGWRWPTGLVVGPVLLLLLALWLGGAFSGVSQEQHDQLQTTAQQITAERDFYRGQIRRFHQEMGTTKEMRKLTKQSFPPYAPATVSSAAERK
ncbi:hypothetical protein KLP40_20680 [Hymenobacter sp. NST-14]|uniref:hypothetical protein n=1 Tax=Hymenobacter piscis TaxID=2839984 RepID=UPI001C015BD5|nr:hypothetical protein [Hymenobacter piscis]MBT9395594.1 hypothetical protein [Hymenobacter piscis]